MFKFLKQFLKHVFSGCTKPTEQTCPEPTARPDTFQPPLDVATQHQRTLLTQLQFWSEPLTKDAADTLLQNVLRPVEYALYKTFTFLHRIDADDLWTLKVAIVHSTIYKKLPRYGPHKTSMHLDAEGKDIFPPLTPEQRMEITDIAFQTLPPNAFLKLGSKGVKRYKMRLDARHCVPNDDRSSKRRRRSDAGYTRDSKQSEHSVPVEYHDDDWLERHEHDPLKHRRNNKDAASEAAATHQYSQLDEGTSQASLDPEDLTDFDREQQRYYQPKISRNPRRDAS